MPPYDDWNKVDDDEEEELFDPSLYEGKRDVILFCIDCSSSMQELYDDPLYEDTKTCHLFTALDAAMQISKRKVVTGPNDSVGILLFNTTRKSDMKRSEGQGSEIKRNTFIYQPISLLSAEKIRELSLLLDAARENPEELSKEFPPLEGKRVPIGDVFTSCNWVLRDGAPKIATKRVFLITDEDDPHSGPGSKQLIISARTTLIDLTQSGVSVEPFFISTPQRPFDVNNFYSLVLLPDTFAEDDDPLSDDPSILPGSISISRIEDLLTQMRFHEVPKRALYSIPLVLGDGLVIGVKGFGLVSEQKKGQYKYFVDLGDRMEVAFPKTVYVDESREAEVDKSKLLFGMDLGATNTSTSRPDEDDDIDITDGAGIDGAIRAAYPGQRLFYTRDEVKEFRTMGIKPGIKLLGFKDRTELAFEDNVKHSLFLYPDELSYSGSKRTFSALLKSMIKKGKIALTLALTRQNSSPTFCALVPQEERVYEGWTDPAGFHMIPLPFADDIRAAPLEEGARAEENLKSAARAWIDKLSVKNGTYPPDSYPNPALAYHNAQLQAAAFREEYDPETFEDLTEPKYEMIHKRAGKLMRLWKEEVAHDESAFVVPPKTGSKRKATAADAVVDEKEFKEKHTSGLLGKFRVEDLKDFCRSKGMAVSGKKADLMGRVAEYLDTH